jgi:cytochrome c-type biogenesis protein CcmH
VRTAAATLSLAGLVSVLLLGSVPVAGAERASLPDIEDEVMCPICGTLLELSESPQAQRERVFIRARIARGDSKQEIKDALVREYGQEVLALPNDSGFDLSAYVVPVLAFIAAAAALLVGVLRWRRRGGGEPPGPPRAAPTEEEAARLDADMARYDL